MPIDHGAAIDRYRADRIPDNPDISDADAELLLDFSDELYLRRAEYSDARHLKLLKHGVMIAEEVGGLADALTDREAAEEIVRWIHTTYDNEETNRDYRVALRVIGSRSTEGDDVPESLEWISASTSHSYDPSPDPSDMLRWEADIQPMLQSCHNPRDKAIIATAWDAGPRAGEFYPITVGDIADHKHGLKLTVDGKQGQRSIPLVPSVPYLQRWLDDHPAPTRQMAPLWSKLSKPEPVSDRMVRKVIEEAADRADVDRPINLTNFRKSSASYLASEGMSQAHLENHHGWTRGSDAAARYIAVFGDASERELARIHGLDVQEDEPDPIGPIECERCGRETPRKEPFCMWCHQALEPGAVEEIQDEQNKRRRELLAFAKERPELLEGLEELEPLVEAMGGDPEVIDAAHEFVEETAD